MSANGCDAFLLVSFGGPEGPDDVMPFLRNVTRGRNVPDERLQEVAHHYLRFGGVSPINELNRQLIQELRTAFDQRKIDLPIYWGNRNWHPMLADTVRQMKEDGVKRAVAIATSAYSCYSSCRQYIEDIERARAAVGEGAPEIEKLPPFWSTSGFLAANEERLKEALSAIGADASEVDVMFTAHSIPSAMASKCDYEKQLLQVSQSLSEKFGIRQHKLTYQSRSGPATQPWLEPDVCDFIRERSAAGMRKLVVHPVGFVADHMEVIYDLDVEAKELCDELGIDMVRASTAGTHPQFVNMICDLVEQHLHRSVDAPSYCSPGCCPSGR